MSGSETEEDAAARCEPQEGCYMVCDANNLTEMEFQESEVVKLKFLTNPHGGWIVPTAERFMTFKQGAVEVEFVEVPFGKLEENIVNEAQSQVGLYDGFLSPPSVAGSIVEYDGWADLLPFIQESTERTTDWADILLGYRKLIAQYEDKIIMYPLDGDVLNMYYRKDVLEHFGLPVPRTWEEYATVAEAVHGKVFENKTLTGSCVGRGPGCASPYWSNLVLSSMTQTQGQWSGFLFDTSTMQPLAGPAMEQALEWMERQTEFGDPDEFEHCIGLNRWRLQEGTCVLSYNWGNTFKSYLHGDSVLKGKLGVAPTPGSTKVLDRQANELVECTEELCPYGTDYEDIGRVNHAPYLAFGGWSCAANNYTNPRKKRLAMEFCAYAASREVSTSGVVVNATDEKENVGQDPFRESHLDVDLYVAQGFERQTTELFLQSIRDGLASQNAVTDIRFPTSPQIYGVLGNEFLDYLNLTKNGLVPFDERTTRRRELTERITSQWADIIQEYESQGTTHRSLLESYQRLRGVYSVEHEYNYINNIRIFGFVLMSVVFLFSIGLAVWTTFYREIRIVKASQPFFLVMICSGTLLMSSAILPMGMDDNHFNSDILGVACMSIPWLLALGWTIVYSALYSKLFRVNQVMRNAARFRRVRISDKDVLRPFAVLFTMNVVLLVTWSLLDPLKWKRFEISETSSYGSCSIDSDRPEIVWQVLVSLLAVVNGVALVLANVEAYRARFVSTEYGESKYIARAMWSLLQAALVAIPLMFLVEQNPSANYFIRSSLVFLVSMSILLFIFVPKVKLWYRGADEVTRSVKVSGLAFTVNIANAQQQLDDYKKKVAQLKQILSEQGINSEQAFNEAGLDENSGNEPEPACNEAGLHGDYGLY